jgi:hypothetical protein
MKLALIYKAFALRTLVRVQAVLHVVQLHEANAVEGAARCLLI